MDITGQPAVIKEINKGIVKSILRESESATKTDIAKASHISYPTVGKLLNEMKECGEVLIVGYDESSGGRRAERYVLNYTYQLLLSLYIEGNSLWVMVTDLKGETIYKDYQAINQGKVAKSKPYQFITSLLELPMKEISYITAIEKNIKVLIQSYPDIKAISIGIPGSVLDGKIKFIPQYDELLDFDLKTYIEERVNLPTFIENDMNAVALGYYYKNIQLLEEDSMIYIYIGKNCPGAGIIINGEVVRGFTAFAGEIGLLPLKDLNLPINSDRLREEQDRLIDWAAKIIVSATCMINPKYVVLCDAQVTESTKSAIEKSCLKYIPCYSMPQILMSDDFYGDYYEGLKKIGLDAINTHYKVIHS